ncbi:MAG: hypothetical protein ACHQAR_04785, partial [Steroidobacterales bacterium]
LEANADFDTVAKSVGAKPTPATFVGRGDPQLPAQVRETAFALPHPAAKPIYRSLALEDGGAVVVALISVRAGTAGANPKNDEQLLRQYSTRHREGDMTAYVLELERRATIERNPSIFE